MSLSNKGPGVDFRLQNLTNALYLDTNNDVVVRTGFAGDIIVSGNVNVPGDVTVNSTPDNPVHVHLTELGTFGNLTTYVPIQGAVTVTGNANVVVVGIANTSIVGNIVGITTLPAITGNVGVSGNVKITQLPGVTGNVHVYGNVSVDNFPSNVSITQMPAITGNVTANVTFPNVYPVSANTSVNSLTNPILVALSKGGLALDDTNGVPIRQINDTNLIGYARNAPVREIDVFSSYLIDKSGATSSLGTTPATMSTVWDAPGLYPWNTFTGTGDKLYVFSTTDDAKIRGKQLVIEGLDSNYNLIIDTVTFNNTNTTTPVATTLNFYRIVRATVAGTNTNLLPHDYNIEIHYGSIGGTLVGQVQAPYGQTQKCTYTVPAGFEAFILSINGSSGKSDEITSMLWTRPYNDTWHQIKTFKFISGSFDHNFRTPYRIPEKSDIEIRAFALVESSRIGTEFQMLVIPKAPPL